MWRHLFNRSNGFRRGDVVEVRSATEIAATLDASGCLEGLQFMPEMALYCGRRYRVRSRASKTCVEGLGLRRMSHSIFLENVRCDGAAHDGCERGCLMFWKEAWLKPSPAGLPLDSAVADQVGTTRSWALGLPTRRGDRYVCQSTSLANATSHLARWNPAHLLRDLADRQLTPRRFLQIVGRVLLNQVRGLLRKREIGGLAGPNVRNPKGNLALAAGDAVVVKTAGEIAGTLDPVGRNQGLSFEPDMADFIGMPFVVERPINRIILEQTGKMAQLTNTVALKGVTCMGLCSKNCPRANPLFWREIWLQRSNLPRPPAAAIDPIVRRAQNTEAAHV